MALSSKIAGGSEDDNLFLEFLAPGAGLEPATISLTGSRTAIVLPRNTDPLRIVGCVDHRMAVTTEKRTLLDFSLDPIPREAPAAKLELLLGWVSMMEL